MSERVKAAVRLRDGMRCIDCDLTNEQHVKRYGRQLDVHRTTPGSPYTLDGCVTACRRCHRRRHRKAFSVTRRTFILQQPLWDAFHAYLESHGEDEPRPDDSEVLRAALRSYLRAKNFWPWPR
jgi:hypothetical protein